MFCDFVFVPLMRKALHCRVQSRILLLRQKSAAVFSRETGELQTGLQQQMRFAEIFEVCARKRCAACALLRMEVNGWFSSCNRADRSALSGRGELLK